MRFGADGWVVVSKVFTRCTSWRDRQPAVQHPSSHGSKNSKSAHPLESGGVRRFIRIGTPNTFVMMRIHRNIPSFIGSPVHPLWQVFRTATPLRSAGRRSAGEAGEVGAATRDVSLLLHLLQRPSGDPRNGAR